MMASSVVSAIAAQIFSPLTLAGGTTIDREFFRFCEEKFPNAFNKVPLKHRTTGSRFMLEFEEAKCSFEGPEAEGQEQDMLIGPIQMQNVDLDDGSYDDGYIRVTR